MTGLLVACAVSLLAADPPDTVVVCCESFVPALQPWLAHRREQGHCLQLLSNDASAEQLRKSIRRAAAGGALKYVVLVGDAPSADAGQPLAPTLSVPTHFVKAQVNIHWGSEAEIASDNGYADLDDDGRPELAVGRITADSRDELAGMVEKILSYEKSPDFGTWRRQINLVAGIGGFGALADAVLEMAARQFLTEGVPAAYHTTMTYGSWQSPYCPDPRLFHDVTLHRLNEGCLFWIYIGHGRRRHLDHVHVPGGAFPILDSDDVQKLNSARGLPIALLLACYTGAFDHAADCLAEDMLRIAGGPAAVICGSRITMPYGMAVMCDAMMDELFRNRRATLGELLLATKRRMWSEDAGDARRELLDALAAAISPVPDQLAEERREHVALINLLGDPLLRLRHPQQIELHAAASLIGGETLQISGRCRVAGPGVVELVCRRDRTRQSPPPRSRFAPTHQFLQSFNETYRRANDPVWTRRAFHAPGGDFQIELPVPPEAHGPCHVRVHVVGGDTFALGATDVFVSRPREEP
jgi:hypothetical protein